MISKTQPAIGEVICDVAWQLWIAIVASIFMAIFGTIALILLTIQFIERICTTHHVQH